MDIKALAFIGAAAEKLIAKMDTPPPSNSYSRRMRINLC